MKSFACPSCKEAIDVFEFLRATSGFSRETNSYCSLCPKCRGSQEFAVRNNGLELGYTYWAGALHFEGMISVPVSNLRVRHSPGRIRFEVGERSIDIPRPE